MRSSLYWVLALTTAGLLGVAVGCGPSATPAEPAPSQPGGPVGQEARPSTSAGAPVGARPSLSQRCEALCTRYDVCQAASAAQCESDCRRRHERAHAHQQAPYLWRLVTCFDGIDCGPLAAGGAEQACEEHVRRQLTPSAELRRFCSESAARAAACHHPADEADCLDRFRTIDAPSLAQALACLDRPCAEVPACFARSFGFAPPSEP